VYNVPKYLVSYFSAYFVIVFVDYRHSSLFTPYRIFVGVSRQVFVAVTIVFARRQRVLVLHELSGELGAPSDVVVAPTPLKRAVRVFRVGAAPAARQHSGRAVPGHGVRQRGRAERVRERLFFRACSSVLDYNLLCADTGCILCFRPNSTFWFSPKIIIIKYNIIIVIVNKKKHFGYHCFFIENVI